MSSLIIFGNPILLLPFLSTKSICTPSSDLQSWAISINRAQIISSQILNIILYFAKCALPTGFGIIPRRGRMQLSTTARSEVKGLRGIREIHLWEMDEPEVDQNSRPLQSLGRVPVFLRSNRVGPRVRSAKHTAASRDTLVKILLRTI